MPSQRMNSGTQAMEGIARSAWMDGSSSRAATGLAPFSMPSRVPAVAPMAKPSRTRVRVATTWVCSSPERASDHAVCASRDGGGISRPGAVHSGPRFPTARRGRPG